MSNEADYYPPSHPSQETGRHTVLSLTVHIYSCATSCLFDLLSISQVQLLFPCLVTLGEAVYLL